VRVIASGLRRCGHGLRFGRSARLARSRVDIAAVVGCRSGVRERTLRSPRDSASLQCPAIDSGGCARYTLADNEMTRRTTGATRSGHLRLTNRELLTVHTCSR
jgi:hypothetical protein